MPWSLCFNIKTQRSSFKNKSPNFTVPLQVHYAPTPINCMLLNNFFTHSTENKIQRECACNSLHTRYSHANHDVTISASHFLLSALSRSLLHSPRSIICSYSSDYTEEAEKKTVRLCSGPTVREKVSFGENIETLRRD